MNYQAMRQLLDARPFRQFDVVSSAGQAHRVKHPECALLTKTQIMIVDPEADVFVVVPLLHVAEARFLAPA